MTGPSLAQQPLPAGNIVDFIPIGTITNSSGQGSPSLGSTVFMGDLLQTGRGGQFQLVLADQTRLVVGENSALAIDEFVLSSPQTASAVTINAVRGAFRFISGNSPSRAYTINTPVATMGISGTAFDVSMGQTLQVALIAGIVNICSFSNACVTIDRTCEVAEVGPNFAEIIPALPGWTRQDQLTYFPYIVSQAALKPEFRLNVRECERVTPVREARETPPGLAPPPPPDPEPEPPPPDPEPEPDPGNPGNDKAVGDAGNDPGGNDMEQPGRGRSR